MLSHYFKTFSSNINLLTYSREELFEQLLPYFFTYFSTTLLQNICMFKCGRQTWRRKKLCLFLPFCSLQTGLFCFLMQHNHSLFLKTVSLENADQREMFHFFKQVLLELKLSLKVHKLCYVIAFIVLHLQISNRGRFLLGPI